MLVFFCFKQKTAYEMRISDWSSDVCSSDLFGQVPFDRAHGRIDETGAVKHGLHFNTGRQGLRHLIELSRNILRHSSAVLADEHEDGADHGLFAVHAARTGAQVTPDPDIDRPSVVWGTSGAERVDPGGG